MNTKTINGTYASGFTLSASYDGLTIGNKGSVSGTGVKLSATGSVQNYGVVKATAADAIGIDLAFGGYLGNGVTGSIAGYVGVEADGASSTVVNSGYIGGIAAGVRLNAGGAVENFGSINAYSAGVDSEGGAAAITNYGVIGAIFGTGVRMASGGFMQNGNTFNPNASIKGETGVAASGASISNVGTIFGAGGIGSYGVNLYNGATLTNGSVNQRSALVKGAVGATALDSGADINNFGTILGLSGAGVALNGGSLVNGSAGDTAALVRGSTGIGGTGGWLTNFGEIVGAGNSAGAYGVAFSDGGTITNGAAFSRSALIEGYSDAVQIGGASGTVTNFGAILAFGAAGQYGVQLSRGGSVTNGGASDVTAVISGFNGVGEYSGTVANYGVIDGLGGSAVDITTGGEVINGGPTDPTAMIQGYSGVTSNGPLALVNFGKVEASTFKFGAVLAHSGTVTNGSRGDTTALIEGGSGVEMLASSGVNNYATILGAGLQGTAGVLLLGGGSVTNGAVNDTAAVIQGYEGVQIKAAQGLVSNFGTILGKGPFGNAAVSLETGGSVGNGSANDTAALIDGVTGVFLGGAGAVANFGTIDGENGYGVVTFGAATVTNGNGTDHSALIEGYIGVELKDGGAMLNFGTIRNLAGGHDAAYLNTGSMTNGTATDTSALIAGYNGLGLEGATATNFGTIVGDGAAATAGAMLGNGSTLTNKTGAVIDGYFGVTVQGGSTLTNFGAIDGLGGVAVNLGSTADTLIVEAGSTFTGQVLGGGGTVELASGVGTITGLPGSNFVVTGSMPSTTFQGFGTLEVGPGGHFSVGGNGTVAVGYTVADAGTLSVAGVLTVAGALTTSGILGGAGTLLLSGNAAFDNGSTLTIAKITQSAGSMATFGAPNLSYAGRWTQTAGVLSAATGDRINFSGVGDSFAGTIAGAGVVAFTGGTDLLSGAKLTAASEIIAGATVTLAGAITLTKTLSSTTPNLIVAAGGATLTGGGTLALSNLATNKIYGASASATLTNSDVISGAGQLGGGSMKLVNTGLGVIDGNRTLGLTINTGAASIVNGGVIEAAGGGTTTIVSAVANTGALEAIGGTLTVDGAVTGAGVVKINGGVADFVATISENVTFTGATGRLELAHSVGFGGTVTGFSKTGATSLDLGDIAFATATESYSATTGVLTVGDGTHTAHIKLAGNYSTSTFTLSKDAGGGTIVVDPTPPAPAHAIGTAPLHGFIAALAGFAPSPPSSIATLSHSPNTGPFALLFARS